MGQKVNPHGLRVGIIKDWDSRWYAEADFADNLVEDYNIRTYLKKRLYNSGVAKIEIERASDRLKIIIHTAKPVSYTHLSTLLVLLFHKKHWNEISVILFLTSLSYIGKCPKNVIHIECGMH